MKWYNEIVAIFYFAFYVEIRACLLPWQNFMPPPLYQEICSKSSFVHFKCFYKKKENFAVCIEAVFYLI